MNAKEKILINLFDIHNKSSLIAIDIFSPKKVIFFVDKRNHEIYTLFEKNCREIFKNVNYEEVIIDGDEIEKINETLEHIEGDITVNVTDGERIKELILFNCALIKKYNIAYIDIRNLEISVSRILLQVAA